MSGQIGSQNNKKHEPLNLITNCLLIIHKAFGHSVSGYLIACFAVSMAHAGHAEKCAISGRLQDVVVLMEC